MNQARELRVKGEAEYSDSKQAHNDSKQNTSYF